MLSPPLREKWNQRVLLNKLKNMELHAYGSDHCSFNHKGQKELGKDDFSKIPNGAPTIEDRVTILYHYGYNAGASSTQLSSSRSARPTPPNSSGSSQEGTIAVGSDGDVVIWDPKATRTISARAHAMNVDNNVFEGMQVQGKAKHVFSRGRQVVRDGTFVGEPGYGTFVRSNPFRPVQL